MTLNNNLPVQVDSASSAMFILNMFHDSAFEALVKCDIEDDEAKVLFIDDYVDKLCTLYEKGIQTTGLIYPDSSDIFDSEPTEDTVEGDQEEQEEDERVWDGNPDNPRNYVLLDS